MLTREQIIVGGYLRALSDCFAVPAGTLGKVDTVGLSRDGQFVFTVRWQHLNPGTKVKPISHRSLNLWEEDLAHFEAVSDERARAMPVEPFLHRQPDFKRSTGSYRRTKNGKRLNPNQLDLFTMDDF
jgi:hypothetical protein